MAVEVVRVSVEPAARVPPPARRRTSSCRTFSRGDPQRAGAAVAARARRARHRAARQTRPRPGASTGCSGDAASTRSSIASCAIRHSRGGSCWRTAFAPDKITTIPNMPRRARVGRLERDGRRASRAELIFVGQIIPEKGLDLLLDAVAHAPRRAAWTRRWTSSATSTGGRRRRISGHRAALRRRAAQPDLADAVHFLGWREDVPHADGRASMHCCPSRREMREAFGIVVLEAKLSGLPSVVAPERRSARARRPRRTGWVCSGDSAQELAEGLRFFLTDAARARRRRSGGARIGRTPTAKSGLPAPGRRCSAGRPKESICDVNFTELLAVMLITATGTLYTGDG